MVIGDLLDHGSGLPWVELTPLINMEGTRFLVIGDLHIRVQRGPEFEDMAKEILHIARETKPDAIVVLGDTLHSHHAINVYPLTWAAKTIFSLVDIAPTYLLIGNHDRPNNSDFLSEYHPFVGMKRTPGLTVIDTVKQATIDGKRFLFVPYVPPGKFAEALATVEDYGDVTAIFAHQEFRGAKMGRIRSKGDPWDKDSPLVVSGHIHTYQRLRKNIVYVGAPGQHNFDDEEARTISTFVFGEKVDRQESSGSVTPWREFRHTLALRPKNTIRTTAEGIVSLDLSDASLWTKVVIEGTLEEIRAVSRLPKIREWKRAGVTIVTEEVAAPTPERVEPTESFELALFREVEKDPELLSAWNVVFRK